MSGGATTRVFILGGGPAGSATAIALLRAMGAARERLELTLLHPTRGPGAPAIGETIPPAATPALDELGLAQLLERGDHLQCPGSVSLWGSDQAGHNDFLLQPVGHGYHLDRGRFDADLLACARALGCRVEPGWQLRSVEQDGRRYRLGCSASGTGSGAAKPTQFHEADFVVDASGIGAAFARRLGVARNLFDEVLCLCALFELPQNEEAAAAHTLVQTQPHGWWYAARLPHRQAIVSLCTDAETLKEQDLLQARTWHRAFLATGWLAEQCRRQFGDAPPVPGRLHPRHTPSAILSALVGDRWLAVGDAASSYDSMSSAGITKALIHARLAGQALADWLENDTRHLLDAYQQRVFEDFNEYLRVHQMHYRSEQRYPQSGFWRRRTISLGA